MDGAITNTRSTIPQGLYQFQVDSYIVLNFVGIRREIQDGLYCETG
jgi:hypothetical protein